MRGERSNLEERFHNRRPHYITYRDSSTAEQLVTCLFAKHVKEFYIAAVNFFVIRRVDRLDASLSSPVQKHRNTAFALHLHSHLIYVSHQSHKYPD